MRIYIEKFDPQDFYEYTTQEVTKLTSLNHENIITFYEYFTDTLFLYLVTEYCEVNIHNINQAIDYVCVFY